MRTCFTCKESCEDSNPFGYCVKELKSLPNGPWDKGYQPSGIQSTQDCSTCSSDCKLYSGCYVGNIHKAATDLVDAVERYVKQGCLRSELIIKTKALKKLL